VSVIALPFPGVNFWHRQRTRLATILDSRPFIVSIFDVPEMREAIGKVLRNADFDLVHIDTTQMGSYVDLVGPGGPKRALVEIDVSMKPLRRKCEQATSPVERWLCGREWRRMREYEPRLCRRFDLVFAVSEEDRALLRQTGAADDAALFRYGVDDDFLDIAPKRAAGVSGASLVFVGSFMHPPNVDAARWFVESIFPTIRARVPAATIHIVGGQHQLIEHLGQHPGVVVTGRVDDVKRYLAMADVCVVPLRWGGGVKLKTLEMMAAGRPVVATAVGTEGIHVQDGADVLLASSAEEFADQTVALLLDDERRETLGRNARALIAREHRWSRNLEELEREYARLVGSGAAYGSRSQPLSTA
jgi:glycosyltransferase involved in cell wall biosynthesis